MNVPAYTLVRPQPQPARTLPVGVAFALLVSIVVSLLAGSIAPSPLYALYQSTWGFSSIATTVIFGIYAIAVLVALLMVGSLSDYVGRRPVLIVALLVQIGGMALFIAASGVADLVLARIIQGLSTGAAIGAVGAGLLDLNKSRGTIANAVAPMTGTATGGILSGLMIQYLPYPTHLVYGVLGAVFLVQAVGVVVMHETSTPKPVALAAIRPTIGLPAALRTPFLLVAPALIAAWALAGFYGSLGPALVREVTQSRSSAVGGLALLALAGSGGVAVLGMRTLTTRTVMFIGVLGLMLGVGLTVLGSTWHSVPAYFIGTIIAGIGFGGSFQGAIRSVVPLAAAHSRAGVLSVVYIVSYLAMGVPAVGAGFRVVHGGGLLGTAREYGVAVMLLAGMALLGLLRPAVPSPTLATPAVALAPVARG